MAFMLVMIWGGSLGNRGFVRRNFPYFVALGFGLEIDALFLPLSYTLELMLPALFVLGLGFVGYKSAFSLRSEHEQEEYPEGIVNSFKLKATMNPPSKDLPEINSKRTVNKSKEVKNGIHPEKKKNKKEEQTMEKVKK